MEVHAFLPLFETKLFIRYIPRTKRNHIFTLLRTDYDDDYEAFRMQFLVSICRISDVEVMRDWLLQVGVKEHDPLLLCYVWVNSTLHVTCLAVFGPKD